jgi:hypothetical protein
VDGGAICSEEPIARRGADRTSKESRLLALAGVRALARDAEDGGPWEEAVQNRRRDHGTAGNLLQPPRSYHGELSERSVVAPRRPVHRSSRLAGDLDD